MFYENIQYFHYKHLINSLFRNNMLNPIIECMNGLNEMKIVLFCYDFSLNSVEFNFNVCFKAQFNGIQ